MHHPDRCIRLLLNVSINEMLERIAKNQIDGIEVEVFNMSDFSFSLLPLFFSSYFERIM